MFKIAVICGGPSPERGISLNSARSLLDHLASETIEIVPLYVDYAKQFYLISTSQLYSNTPADFDFKLASTAQALNPEELISLLKRIDLVFPVIHGPFGEDGQLAGLLEEIGVPFVGSNQFSCQQMYCKHTAQTLLKSKNFPTIPSVLLTSNSECYERLIHQFFRDHHLKKGVIKPVFGGSSIGVFSVKTPQEAIEKCQLLFEKGHERVLLERFFEGKEFTVVVFENLQGQPVAFVPTEIEMSYENNQIFDYRRKYLSTNQVVYHTPPRFSEKHTQQIRQDAETLFTTFQMNDFVRLDGWIGEDQQIYFTDMNPISGLEQNSFLFRQAALLGLTHRQALYHLIRSACRRFNLECPTLTENHQENRLPVYVLFGGSNAERQVSLMSGTNIWLKLLRSTQYLPILYFYDKDRYIWQLPYSYALDHTVEEIYHHCKKAKKEDHDDGLNLLSHIQQRLNVTQSLNPSPQQQLFTDFIRQAQEQQAFVFIAMHGGEGENGTLQQLLESHQIPYNGSNSVSSALGMDKYLTGEVIKRLADPFILTLPKKTFHSLELPFKQFEDFQQFWNDLTVEFDSQRCIIKPRCDGCSAGIVLLQSAQDLKHYIELIQQQASFIPAHTFINQKEIVEMPVGVQEFIIEPYIETDSIAIEKNSLRHLPKEGWIELTVGVLEKDGVYQALNPSITIAEGAVLSLEEKFQGGTGVNLTPPPVEIISPQSTETIKRLIEKTAAALEIHNYARLDIFFNYLSEKMVVIEVNTLPGLTPSTVLYHQALAENPSLKPLQLLERIISSKLNSLVKV